MGFMNKRRWAWLGIGAAGIALIALVLAFALVPPMVDRSMNSVVAGGPFEAEAAAAELHKKLFIADLHTDSLLWNRDLLVRNGRGHVDLPRLVDGNVALQAFTVVTKTPKSMNIEANTPDSDNITLLAFMQRWPPATWTSLLERALYQARRLEDAAERSEGGLVVIRTQADLKAFADRREKEPQIVAGLLGIEGLHCLEGKLENVDRLFEAGFRMMGPAHFFDNEVSGSAHGAAKGGLTKLGRQVINRMEELNILVDLAHASPATIDDILAMAKRPVVVSHTGVRGTCDNSRNLSDDHVRRIGENGGVIGIAYFDSAVCKPDVESIVAAIKHAAGIAGADHVALGSDFDGTIEAPFDTTGLVKITEGLMKAGFGEDEIAGIMGRNTLRLLESALPPG
jgi:microsomal dipeptidase-like Zn-dependent dipeptidase